MKIINTLINKFRKSLGMSYGPKCTLVTSMSSDGEYVYETVISNSISGDLDGLLDKVIETSKATVQNSAEKDGKSYEDFHFIITKNIRFSETK